MQNKANRLQLAYNELVNRGMASSKKDIANRMGASLPNVYSAFSGAEKVLTDKFLKRFNLAFDCIFSIEWLIYGRGHMLANEQLQIPNERTENMTVNQRFKRFLEELHISAAEFADVIGSARPSISLIAGGKRPLSRGMIARIKNQYPQLNLAWLESGEGDMFLTASGVSQFVGGNGSNYNNSLVHIGSTEVGIDDPTSTVKTCDECAVLEAKIKHLQELLAEKEQRLIEKDERIAELKERISELKAQEH